MLFRHKTPHQNTPTSPPSPAVCSGWPRWHTEGQGVKRIWPPEPKAASTARRSPTVRSAGASGMCLGPVQLRGKEEWWAASLAVRRPWDGEESCACHGNQGAMEEP